MAARQHMRSTPGLPPLLMLSLASPLPCSPHSLQDDKEDKEAAKLRKAQQKVEAAAARKEAAAKKRAAAEAAAVAAGGKGGGLFGRGKVAPAPGGCGGGMAKPAALRPRCLGWCPQLHATLLPPLFMPPAAGKAGGGVLSIVVRAGSKDQEGEALAKGSAWAGGRWALQNPLWSIHTVAALGHCWASTRTALLPRPPTPPSPCQASQQWRAAATTPTWPSTAATTSACTGGRPTATSTPRVRGWAG